MLCSGSLAQISIIKEYYCLGDRFVGLLLAHLKLTVFAVSVACLVGIPLGMAALRSERCEKMIFLGVNVFQTIPSLALFGLLMIPLAYLSWRFPYLRMIGIKGVGFAGSISLRCRMDFSKHSSLSASLYRRAVA
ncbi:MAG: hypothetical protein U9N81_08925 [Bacillota bacterium]|nr:hypothetical protein [Bacillota bacterium]